MAAQMEQYRTGGYFIKDVERMTLAGNWQKCSEDDSPTETGQKEQWKLAEGLREALPEAMCPYYDRWRALQKG